MNADANMLDLYLYANGKSDVPQQFTRWVCLTIIAASVSDRIWMRKSVSNPKIIPNLYTILTGQSGVSKGMAIDFGEELLSANTVKFRGGPTYKGLIDFSRKVSPQFLLIMPELSANIGDRRMADQFVKHMTDWYTGFGRGMIDSTRAHGVLQYQAPCITLLAASTVEWLAESITREAVLGGFFGRSIVIHSDVNYEDKLYRAEPPADFETCKKALMARLHEMTFMGGEMKLTYAARDLDEYWFHTRRDPEPGMEPFFQREPVLVLKLAMLMSLTDGFDMTVDVQHIEAAHVLVREIKKYIPRVVEECLADPVVKAMRWIQRTVHQRGRMEVNYLAKLGRQLGHPTNIVREALMLGDREGEFENRKVGNSNFVYLIGEKYRPKEIV